MLAYRDVQAFVEAGLRGRGYDNSNPPDPAKRLLPRFDPGPVALTQLQNLSPGPMCFITVGNGSGLTLEQTYDGTFITVRTLGEQGDYDGAERLAYDVDQILLAVNSPALLGATRVLYVNRTGGPPQLVDWDSSERYHFQTTYITPAASGL